METINTKAREKILNVFMGIMLFITFHYIFFTITNYFQMTGDNITGYLLLILNSGIIIILHKKKLITIRNTYMISIITIIILICAAFIIFALTYNP